ncbi:DNA mismatch repair ATPase MutS [Clostridium acetobutylicum]|uniref:Mismatch repair protein MutS-like ATPase n=1 Tax=Clostridium acetobutylicum (strain ATCC 824 / DSM 792 / JCM 1419 / IAM 19013 / LMG 5710 / NBRC 13948 / NRRL B-527 / VKM B-1787 / 2291 / W) TaxID=272562 RepID=Q97DB6_CLOAB|nr:MULTISPECIES: MutS family DNA mismatch repair protein [Clostridium]AAK81487.1 Mismatch repair protein MutS-like ATPase [Clostridium acetobutylicum ATCC 824]ADZ22606.1 Mismatch repair protein MutS-like ATPase [Clostridium acetobutylicum EA 2018]AEI34385.1 mismatch repair protein MutS-like ATPase [Clostridium acetobutylicum DSM 1731]AWV80839.1 MutS family DNA mismatch repair protein [Clostridium acetobutylicum]MBC2393834.1 MutS family DNA mismatch repair protein [Clostridium acetobutylicum]
MDEDKLYMYSAIATLALGISAFVFFQLAIGYKNYIYFLGTALSIAAIFLAFYMKAKIIHKLNYERFKRYWGEFQKRKRNTRNVKKFFEFHKEDNADEFNVDEQTWEDLNMNKVFELADRTLTSPGEEMLYKIFKTPEFSKEKLLERNSIIKIFQNNKEVREKVGLELIKLGRKKENGVTDLIWKDIEVDYKYKYVFNFLFWGTLASILTIPILKYGYIILLAAFILMNTIEHNKFKNKVELYVQSLGYLNGIINTANRISKINCPEIKYYTDSLKATSSKLMKVAKKTAGIERVEGVDIIGDALYNILPIEERKFFNSINDIRKLRKELKELYKALGEIDALMSIASFRQWIQYYCEPEFVDNGRIIKCSEIYHPLLENPVSNSIDLDGKGIMLTGTNMAGKSTFLRTIGLNSLLAQTIYTCAAKVYKTSFFKIMTSISPEDNISSGKSYYFREAEALKRIINQCSDDRPVLCIIDEIFRGTNPIERVNASAEILNYIEKHNTLTLVATHDLELTEILKEDYLCCYFSEDIDDEGLQFDYKLKYGICKTRNAVKLLKYLEYPNEIIQKTNDRLAKIL